MNMPAVLNANDEINIVIIISSSSIFIFCPHKNSIRGKNIFKKFLYSTIKYSLLAFYCKILSILKL